MRASNAFPLEPSQLAEQIIVYNKYTVPGTSSNIASQPFETTVIIPAFNAEKTLKQTINSVQSQTHETWHLIVVDDGSFDKTRQVVEAISDSRISIISQKNSGVSAARNCGIRSTTSEFVTFLDADDRWEPQYLESVAHALRAYPTADVFYSNFFREDHKRNQASIDRFTAPIPVDDYFSFYFSYGASASASTTTMRTQIIKDIGGFPIGTHLGEDLDTWARLAWHNAKFVYVPEVLGVYADSRDSLSKQTKNLDIIRPQIIDSYISAIQGGCISDNIRLSSARYVSVHALSYLEGLIVAEKIDWARKEFSFFNANVPGLTRNQKYHLIRYALMFPAPIAKHLVKLKQYLNMYMWRDTNR